ncbi:unnamed protein product, partial [Rotaria magnacalcarata]
YQLYPQYFLQSYFGLFPPRTRRSADYNSDLSNSSVYNNLSKNSRLPLLIDSVSKVNIITTLLATSSSIFESYIYPILALSCHFITKFLSSKQEDHIEKRRSKRATDEYPTRIASIMQLYNHLNYNPHICEFMTEDLLTMPGDVLHDADIQFESQARLALTLSHFLSSFYQIVNSDEDFPMRKAEVDLTDEQLIGEVLAAVASDHKVVGVGIFFDRGKFRNYRLPYFGPYAFRIENDINRKYAVVDWAGLPDGYENEIWFRTMKARWATNGDRSQLTEYWLKLFIRADYFGSALVPHESGFPLYFHAPELNLLEQLCISMLDMCEPIFGRGFLLGKYKCRCRPGYEYPFLDQNDFFLGDVLDTQWDILLSNTSRISSYDILKCRIAIASSIKPISFILLLSSISFAILLST